MKAAQMAECLLRIAPLLEEGEAIKLRQLSEIVRQTQDKSFGSYCLKVEKGLAAAGLTPSDNATAEILGQMGGIAQAAGAAPLSKDFIAAGRLLRALGRVDAMEMQATIVKALAAATKKPPRQPKPAPIDPRTAADQLTALSQDRVRFDALLNEVAKLPKAKLLEVATLYLGYKRPYGSKNEIKNAISSRWLQDAIDQNREARGSKITV